MPMLTTQHPHPVPLDLTRSPSPGSINSYDLGHHDHTRDDFFPLSDSGRWLEEGHDDRLDDGLDLLVPEGEYPVGTPGGKKADLRIGAFVDGAKREKNGKSTIELCKAMLTGSDPVLFERHVFSASLFHTVGHASQHFSTSFLIDLLHLNE